MSYLSSGNDAVDQIGRMNIAGNIVPAVWFRTILTDSNRPYYLAIMILSDIVYWYRPTEIRDERSGQLLGWKKKFHNDMLQRNYEEYAALMGESERSVIRAIAQLEQLGVVRRHRQDLVLKSGLSVKNVLFLELVPARLYELTFADISSETPQMTENVSSPDRICKDPCQNLQEGLPEFVSSPARICKDPCQNLQRSLTEFVSSPDRICKDPCQNLQGGLPEFVSTPDRICKPYTNITTKINTNKTTESTSINLSVNQSTPGGPQQALEGKSLTDRIDPMDEIAAYSALIKENIEYEWHKKYDSPYDWEMFDELFQIICDVVCVKRKTVRVNDEEYPYELVKAKFLKLTGEHLNYVISCMKKTTTPVRNIRSYMITALYNAPSTIDNYFTREVNYDMYRA